MYSLSSLSLPFSLSPPFSLFQVLSESVADALAYFGDPKTEETEKFIQYFDKFFDCLNVRSLSKWKTSRKPDRKPYTSFTAPRLEVRLTARAMHCIIKINEVCEHTEMWV